MLHYYHFSGEEFRQIDCQVCTNATGLRITSYQKHIDQEETEDRSSQPVP